MLTLSALNLFNLLLIICFIQHCSSEIGAPSCKGCVPLDEYNFNKIRSKFNLTLVKFDVPYPYGPKHEAFEQFADELYEIPELLIGLVGIKDYGNRDNEELGKRYGVTKDNLPAIRLFNGEKVVDFPETDTWTTQVLREFLRKHSSFYIKRPGCIEELDQVALKFIEADEGSREKLLKKVEEKLENLSDDVKTTASSYLKYMKKIIGDGAQFVDREIERLTNLLSKNVSEKKKTEISHRMNILYTFNDFKMQKSHDEL